MDLFRCVHVALRHRIRLLAVGILVLCVGPAPLIAADCSECDVPCNLRTNPSALIEQYKDSPGGFAARATKCGTHDETWLEILDNFEALDQPPPGHSKTARRVVTKLDLIRIGHIMAIRDCMLLCGLERFQLDCVAGPGGKSCNCKPGAGPYCEAEANKSTVGSIAPSFASTMTDGEWEVSDDTPEVGEDEAGETDAAPETAEEPRYLIEVAVTADGFDEATATEPCHVEPSSVTVEGTVVDESRMPVAGARVSLRGLGATIVTDANGRYSLTARTEGDTPFRAHRDFVITRLIGDLRATVAPSSAIFANGRDHEAVLTVTADGRPLAGREVVVTGWKGFTRSGSPVDYVEEGRSNHHTLRLDDEGRAQFRIAAPVVPPAKKALREPDTLFPVEGHFRVMVRGQAAETECAYQVESPFPRISRFRVPGNVDVGLWQVDPSVVEIADHDSSRFTVTVRAAGDLRTTRPMAAINRGILTDHIDTTTFEFLYRPPKVGLDPTALPDELDQFMETNMKIYISVTTNVAGGMLLDELQVFSKPGIIDQGLGLIGAKTDAAKVLDAASNISNSWNYVVSAYNLLKTEPEDRNDLKPEEAEKIAFAFGDFMVGAVDTSMGFAQTLKSPQAKLKWEAAKAYWEYLKLINSIQNQYEDLASAYQDTLFYPVKVTVEDERGHRATSKRACSVRVWTKGSE